MVCSSEVFIMELFLSILKAIVFGIIEGITEWLPVSSTGHLIIAEEFLGFSGRYGIDFSNLFIVVIQFGAILAVLIAFFKKIWPFGKSKTKEEKKQTWMLILNVVIACLPAVIVGVLFDDVVDQYLYGALVIAITLILFGIVFIVAEWYRKKHDTEDKTYLSLIDITWKSALIIGLAQMVAIIPGVSRSGITIIAALLIGFSRSSAAEFSFIISIPMIIGASGFKLVKFVASGDYHNIPSELMSEAIVVLLVGVLVSFVVSIFTIKFFMTFIKSKTFAAFGYYRIGLGILVLILGLTQVISLLPNVAINVSLDTLRSIDILNLLPLRK